MQLGYSYVRTQTASGTLWLLCTARSLAGLYHTRDELLNSVYVFPRWKEAEKLKGNFLANMSFSKLGSELKYHADRYNCHHFGMQDGAFGSESFLQ